MPQPRLIIFDCDGVLVDSEPLANKVMRAYLNENGLPVTLEQTISRFVGLSMASMRRIILDEDGLTLPDDFEAEVLRRDEIVFESNLEAISGVADTLERLCSPFCLASSGAHEKIRNSLRLTGLAGYFKGTVFSADDVKNGKPAPDLFLHAASKMNAEAADVIVIEDSIAGVSAGVAANMRVFGFLGGGHITDGHAEKLMAAGAERVFGHMNELSRLIGDSPS
jgi:HAD superfamily hydrolase (TIGR01509 family)